MEIFDIIKSVIFGIVEGITEWLPISSTGHMILLNEILPLRIGKNPDDFYSMFEVVIQLGAIMAVVVLFWSQIWPFGRKDNKAPLAKTRSVSNIRPSISKITLSIMAVCSFRRKAGLCPAKVLCAPIVP